MTSVSELYAQIAALTKRAEAAETALKVQKGEGAASVVPNLAEMLRSEAPSYGTLIQSTSPFWVAWGGPYLAREVDFIFIDTEHTPVPRDTLSALCGLYKGLGLPVLVRVINVEQARQAIDGGANGVVTPYMETLEEVKDLKGSTKLRPLQGERQDAAQDGKYESTEIAEYVKKGGSDKALVLNIESQPAIDNLDKMLAVGLVDSVLIGPHDLSCNLGVPEQYDHPKFQTAVKTIFSKARAAGVGAGIHQIGPMFGAGMQNSDAATMIRDWGCNVIVHGGDLVCFIKGLQEGLAEIREEVGGEKGSAKRRKLDVPAGGV